MNEFEEALEEVVPTATDENRDLYRQMAKKMKDLESDEEPPDYFG